MTGPGHLAAASRPAESPALAPVSPTGLRSLRKWLVHLGLLALGVGLVALAASKVSVAEVRDGLLRVDARTLGLAFVAYTAAWSLRVARLRYVAHAAGVPLAWLRSAEVAFGANALNLVAPARLGDLAAFVRLREVAGGRGAVAAAVALTWRLADLGALMVLALLVGLPLLWLVPIASAEAGLVASMVAGAGFLVFALGAVWAARHHKVRAILAALTRRLLGRHAPTGAAFGLALAHLWHPGRFAVGLALALGAWLADTLVAGLMLQAVTGRADAYLIVVVPILLANAAKLVPTTPGAIGVFEGVLAYTLHAWYGVDLALALAAAVATHLFMNLYTLAFGIPGAFSAGRSVSRLAT